MKNTAFWASAVLLMLCLPAGAMQLSNGPQEKIVIEYTPDCPNGAFQGAVTCCDFTPLAVISNPRDVEGQAVELIKEILAPKKRHAS